MDNTNTRDTTIVVEIPSIAQHEGYPCNVRKYRIPAKCPICGAKRAVKAWRGLSYDGSRRQVDCWRNECEHVDKYSDVRAEGEVVPYDTPSITDTTSSKGILPRIIDMP